MASPTHKLRWLFAPDNQAGGSTLFGVGVQVGVYPVQCRATFGDHTAFKGLPMYMVSIRWPLLLLGLWEELDGRQTG